MKKRLDWDDLRVFVAVARAGRFSAASPKLQLDHSTIARRIDRLERALGLKVFDRSPLGVALTPQGASVFQHAARAEAKFIDAADALSARASGVGGTVRLAAPEELGVLIVQNLHGLTRLHPGLLVEMITTARPVSLGNREADVVIAGDAPSEPDATARKLWETRLGLFAAPGYLAAHGAPAGLEELSRHPFVGAPRDMPELTPLDVLQRYGAAPRVVFRSSSAVAQQNAVAAGCGLGLLDEIAAEGDPRLVRILRETAFPRTYWATFRASQQRVARIKVVLAFLQTLGGRAGKTRRASPPARKP